MQISIFQIGELTFAVHHDGTFNRILNRFKLEPAQSAHKATATFEISLGTPPVCPPEGSVLTRKVSLGSEREYRLGSTIYDFKSESFFAERNLRSLHFKAVLANEDESTLRSAASAFKWLVIAAAEKCGFTYMHASAMRLNELNILFCGHSGSGKSSCLMRLISAGASVITDDSALLRDGLALPFDTKPSLKGDFSIRFPNAIDAVSEMQIVRNLHSFKPDIVIFPNIWQSAQSQIVEIDVEVALEKMYRIYQKECEWNSIARSRNEMLNLYRDVTQNCTFHDFLGGGNESNASATLKTFINQYKKI